MSDFDILVRGRPGAARSVAEHTVFEHEIPLQRNVARPEHPIRQLLVLLEFSKLKGIPVALEHRRLEFRRLNHVPEHGHRPVVVPGVGRNVRL